jgi:uncharacterized membrane protein
MCSAITFAEYAASLFRFQRQQSLGRAVYAVSSFLFGADIPVLHCRRYLVDVRHVRSYVPIVFVLFIFGVTALGSSCARSPDDRAWVKLR